MNRFLLILLLGVFLNSCSTKRHSDQQTVVYFDKVMPDSIPMVFGKGIVSVEGRFDMGFTLSGDGKSMAFGVAHESNAEETCIYLMNYVNGQWTSPDKSFLPDNMNTFFPMFSPTGDELYFAKAVGDSETDLWLAQYHENKAIAPQPLDSTINSLSREAGHSKSNNGMFYFTSNRDDQNQCCGDIYYTQLESNGQSQIQKSTILSSEADEESLFLSPEGDYIIVQAWKYDSESKHDLYISYRTKEGQWTVPELLNSLINSKEIEQRPFVSPDNGFLFFSRMSIEQKNEQDVYDSDIYWVSTKSVFAPFAYNPIFDFSIANNQEFELNLSQDIFKDIDDERLSFRLTFENDSAIPDSMEFDDQKLILRGQWNIENALTFKLTATDPSGNSGDFIFTLESKNTN
jgi:hypothetical protein